jgi:hypothetical protein
MSTESHGGEAKEAAGRGVGCSRAWVCEWVLAGHEWKLVAMMSVSAGLHVGGGDQRGVGVV